jgi:hypothetical protein
MMACWGLERATDSNHRITERVNRIALAIILFLHIAATCTFFPPWEALRAEPLYIVDYPVHTHRVYIYREALLESGLPWGYNPAVSAGTVVKPGFDLGAKSQQVLGLLLPFLSPGAIVRIFLFLVVLTFPLWTLLACHLLRIPSDAQVCVMVSLIVPVWFLKQLNIYFFTGLVGFAAASYFSIYVLALFIAFLRSPQRRTYISFCLAGALLFLLHAQGPVALIPALVIYSLTWPSLSWRWRIAVLLAPVVIVILNAFWLVPFLLQSEMPSPDWTRLAALANPDQHLTYDSWTDLFDRFFRPLWIGPQILGLSLAIYGFIKLRRFTDHLVALSFGLVSAFALFLTYFGSFLSGSFLPVFVITQPVRFVLAAFVFLTLPVGVALATLIKTVRLPVGFSMAALAVVLAVPAIGLGWLESLPLPPSPDSLAEFVAHRTAPTDRLLIQSWDGYRNGGYETQIFPLRFEREVIGCTFSQVQDPAQFLDNMLLGRELKDWSKDELKLALERWGVAWVFTVTSEGHALLARTVGIPAVEVGNYRAFQVQTSATRFLVGEGVVEVKVNRIELRKLRPQNGLVVIRYRYHPAWQAMPHVPILSYAIPEDPSGFIALQDPPDSVTLRFNPLAMVHAKWPEGKLNPIKHTWSEQNDAAISP